MADTDGSVAISIDLTVGEAEKELARLKKRFLSLQADVTEGKARKTALEKELEHVSAQLDEIRAKNKNGVIPANDTNAKALLQRVEQLNAEIDKTDSSIRNSEIALEGVKARYGEVATEAERLNQAQEQPQGRKINTENAVRAGKAAQEATEKTSYLSQAMDKLSPILGGIVKGFEMVGQIGGAVFQTIGDLVSSAIHAVGNGIKKVFSAAGNAITKTFSAAGKSIFNAAKNLFSFNNAGRAATPVFTRLGNLIKNAFVFNVISQGLNYVKQQIWDYLQTNTQFVSALSQLKSALASAFAPIFSAVVPALTTLINWITSAITAVAQFIALLFGKTARFTKGTTGGAKAGSAAMGKEADAIEDVGEAAEEAAGSLASFDEINTIATENAEKTPSPNKGSGGGGGGGGGGGTAGGLVWEDIEKPFDDWGQAFSDFLDKILNEGIPKLREAFEKFAEWFNGFNQKLYDMFTFPGVEEKVILIGQRLAEAFNHLVDLIDWELFGRALGAGLNLALQLLVSFIYSFDWIALGGALSQFINGLVDEINWYSFGQLLWARFKIALETLAGFLQGLNMPQLAQAASDIALGFFNSITDTFSRIDWNKIGTQIATFLNEVKWGEVATAAYEAIKTVLSSIGDMVVGFLQEIKPEILLAIGLLIAAIALGIPQLIMSHLALAGIIAILLLKWQEIMDGITRFISETDWASLIEQAIQLIITFITSADWAGFANSTFEVIGAAFGAAIGTLWQLILDAWEQVVTWWHDTMFEDGHFTIQGLLDGILDALLDIATWIVDNIFTPFINGFKAAFGIASPSTVMQEQGGYLIEGMHLGMEEKWPVVTSFIETMKQFFSTSWDNIKNTVQNAFNAVMTVIGNIWQSISEKVKTIVNTIAQTLSEKWQSIKRTAQSAFDTVRSVIGNIWDSISSKVSSIVSSIAQTLSGKWQEIQNAVQSAHASIQSTFSSVWNAIVGVVQSAANTIKSIVDGIGNAISSAISAASSMGSKIGGAVSGIFGGRSIAMNTGVPVFPVPDFQIPALAAGAVIPPNRSFLAMLGDQNTGTNVEAPLNTIKQALLEAMAEGGMGNADIHITVDLDGREVAKTMVHHINRMTRAAGKPVILY